MEAIGMIEVRGITSALACIDAMAKAANVRLLDMKKIGSGFVVVMIEGDVAAVTSAVEVSSTIPEKVGGEKIAINVIPRPHHELSRMLE